MTTPEAHKQLTKSVARLFNTVGAEDIVSQGADGTWFVQGKAITDGEKKMLIAEAQHFLNTRLWKVLKADVQYQANRKMFILSKDVDDLIAGKLCLYLLDVLQTRLSSMAKGSGLFNAK